MRRRQAAMQAASPGRSKACPVLATSPRAYAARATLAQSDSNVAYAPRAAAQPTCGTTHREKSARSPHCRTPQQRRARASAQGPAPLPNAFRGSVLRHPTAAQRGRRPRVRPTTARPRKRAAPALRWPVPPGGNPSASAACGRWTSTTGLGTPSAADSRRSLVSRSARSDRVGVLKLRAPVGHASVHVAQPWHSDGSTEMTFALDRIAAAPQTSMQRVQPVSPCRLCVHRAMTRTRHAGAGERHRPGAAIPKVRHPIRRVRREVAVWLHG